MHTLVRYKTRPYLNEYETVVRTARAMAVQRIRAPHSGPLCPLAAADVMGCINRQLDDKWDHVTSRAVGSKMAQAAMYSQLIRVKHGRYFTGTLTYVVIPHSLPWLHAPAWWNEGGDVGDVIRDLVDLTSKKIDWRTAKIKVWGWRGRSHGGNVRQQSPNLLPESLRNFNQIEVPYTLLEQKRHG